MPESEVSGEQEYTGRLYERVDVLRDQASASLARALPEDGRTAQSRLDPDAATCPGNLRSCREEVMPLACTFRSDGVLAGWIQRPVSWLPRCCYYPPVVAGQGEFRVPAPADEARLWALVEAAWAPLGPGVRQARQELVTRHPGSRADISAVAGALPAFLDILTGCSRGLSADELTRLDRVVERKLWELDRADVHAVTGGSDDGFLYSRGFVVAMGREFCDAVAGDPEMGVPDAECEEMCYFFAHLCHDQFREFPDTGSGISRESGSNLMAWI